MTPRSRREAYAREAEKQLIKERSARPLLWLSQKRDWRLAVGLVDCRRSRVFRSVRITRNVRSVPRSPREDSNRQHDYSG